MKGILCHVIKTKKTSSKFHVIKITKIRSYTLSHPCFESSYRGKAKKKNSKQGGGVSNRILVMETIRNIHSKKNQSIMDFLLADSRS